MIRSSYRHRNVDHRADGDGVVNHHRALLDSTHAQDRHLRLIDDRETEEVAEDARVRDRESSPLNIIRQKLFCPRTAGQVVDCTGQSGKVLAVGLFHDRNN